MYKTAYPSLKGSSRHVSQERMQEILARNTKVNGNSGASSRALHDKPLAGSAPDAPTVTASAVQSVMAESNEPITGAVAALQWLKPETTGPGTAIQRSVCERYRIDAVKSQLSIGFTAWAMHAANSGLNLRLGCASNGPEARALCELHYTEHPSVGAQAK